MNMTRDLAPAHRRSISSNRITNSKQTRLANLQPELTAQPRAGFTFVELLVIIGLVAFCAAMLAPALAKTKPGSQSVQCMNHLKQLTTAWIMYAGDYNGTLVINNNGAAARNGADTSSWIAGWLDWTASLDNINTDFIANERWAKMAPYFARSPKLFKCPADNYKSVQNPGPRCRSISMDAAMGYGNSKESFFGGTFFVAKKMSDLVNPPPARAWVLLDEHPDSINDGCFFDNPLLSPGSYSWTDLPASYHNGGCGISFADGHSEIKRWQVASTRQPVRLQDYFPLNCPNSADYAWLMARTPKKP